MDSLIYIHRGTKNYRYSNISFKRLKYKYYTSTKRIMILFMGDENVVPLIKRVYGGQLKILLSSTIL